MPGGPLGEQHQFVPPLAQREKQREQDRHHVEPVAERAPRSATAPAAARSTNPMAIVSTSMMTMCFSGPE